jgi:hypothetical protein
MYLSTRLPNKEEKETEGHSAPLPLPHYTAAWLSSMLGGTDIVEIQSEG